MSNVGTLNILGEFLAENSSFASHRRGGDKDEPCQKPCGTPGCQNLGLWMVQDEKARFCAIVRAQKGTHRHVLLMQIKIPPKL
jgi:hypothetical protein